MRTKKEIKRPDFYKLKKLFGIGVMKGAIISLMLTPVGAVGFALGQITNKSELEKMASQLADNYIKERGYNAIANVIMRLKLEGCKNGDNISSVELKREYGLKIYFPPNQDCKYAVFTTETGSDVWLNLTIITDDNETIELSATKDSDGEVIRVFNLDDIKNQTVESLTYNDPIWSSFEAYYPTLEEILRVASISPEVSEKEAKYWKDIAKNDICEFFEDAIIKFGTQEIADEIDTSNKSFEPNDSVINTKPTNTMQSASWSEYLDSTMGKNNGIIIDEKEK